MENNRKLSKTDVEQAIEDASERLRPQELNDVELREQMMAAQEHNPVTGFLQDCAGAIVLLDEFNRRRNLPAASMKTYSVSVWDGFSTNKHNVDAPSYDHASSICSGKYPSGYIWTISERRSLAHDAIEGLE